MFNFFKKLKNKRKNMDIDFNSEMDMNIAGSTWYNSKGDHFTVKDIIMDGDGFAVTTTDGRMISGEQMSNYIQSSKPINLGRLYDEPKKEPIIDESADIFQDDLNMIIHSTSTTPITENTAKKNPDYDIIDRALKDNIKSAKTDIILNWKFPKSEIDALKNLLKIDEKSIIDYLKNNLKETLINKLDDCIGNYLKDYLTEKKSEKKPATKKTKSTKKS